MFEEKFGRKVPNNGIYKFELTSYACPEQYTIRRVSDGVGVGYVRLRHGDLVLHPIKDDTILFDYMIFGRGFGTGIGEFDSNEERLDMLTTCENALHNYLTERVRPCDVIEKDIRRYGQDSAAILNKCKEIVNNLIHNSGDMTKKETLMSAVYEGMKYVLDKQNTYTMDFRQALKAAYEGKRIALPEWGGYWFVEDGLLRVFTKEGEYKDTPWIEEYCKRTDWIVL